MMCRVPLTLPAGEPPAGPWTTVPIASVVDHLTAGRTPGRPHVVAVDGRSAAGKTTFTDRLTRAVPASAVVHADDVAWWEPYFTWAPLLRDHVLAPLRAGEAVDFRPPAWGARAREGSITVAAGLDLVVVEGVGSGGRELTDVVDAVVWVQSDFAEAERRGIARDLEQGVNGDHDETVAFWHEWMAEELAYLERDRPWQRAALVVAGTPDVLPGPDEVVVAEGPLLG